MPASESSVPARGRPPWRSYEYCLLKALRKFCVYVGDNWTDGLVVSSTEHIQQGPVDCKIPRLHQVKLDEELILQLVKGWNQTLRAAYQQNSQELAPFRSLACDSGIH